MWNTIRRVLGRFNHSKAHAASNDAVTAPTPVSAFEFDPMWHGDHWQNLLSSPMDARRYVMEDWSVAPSFGFTPAGVPVDRF